MDTNGNHRLCLKSKPQVSVTKAYQQDKPRKARRTCDELSTLDRACKLPNSLESAKKEES